MKLFKKIKLSYFLKNSKGFSLLEVIIFFVIAGIAMVGFAPLFSRFLLTKNANERLLNAVVLAEQKMEQLRSTKFTSIPDLESETYPSTYEEKEYLNDHFYNRETYITSISANNYLIEIIIKWKEPLRPINNDREYKIATYIFKNGINKYVNLSD